MKRWGIFPISQHQLSVLTNPTEKQYTLTQAGNLSTGKAAKPSSQVTTGRCIHRDEEAALSIMELTIQTFECTVPFRPTRQGLVYDEKTRANDNGGGPDDSDSLARTAAPGC